jgi:ribosomal protein S5
MKEITPNEAVTLGIRAALRNKIASVSVTGTAAALTITVPTDALANVEFFSVIIEQNIPDAAKGGAAVITDGTVFAQVTDWLGQQVYGNQLVARTPINLYKAAFTAVGYTANNFSHQIKHVFQRDGGLPVSS